MPDLTDHTVLYAMTSADGIPEGTAAYLEEFSVTEYLKVEGHEPLRLWMPAAKDAFPVPFGICFYDSNKKLLKNHGVTMPYGRKDGEPDRNTKRINPETFCGKWGYYKFHVGIDISFETFVTAARYPDSIFGERTGQTEPDFDSSPYGTYCSALVGYALGYQQPLPKVVEFCDSENFVKVTGIEVSEATTVGNGNNTVLYTGLGGLCRRKMWKPEELYHWYQNYSLFRIVSFRGISYEKSEFVDVGHESNSMPVVDLPLIPYLGNGAKYKKDHIVNDRVLIGASGFTEVVIEKDGEPFRALPIEGKKYVNGGFSEEGSYTAYLSDGTVRTRACRWTVE